MVEIAVLAVAGFLSLLVPSIIYIRVNKWHKEATNKFDNLSELIDASRQDSKRIIEKINGHDVSNT